MQRLCMKKDKTLYPQLMMQAFGKIRSYLGEMSLDEFAKNDEKQSAVIMQLHVLGELAKNTSPDIKKEIDIQWKEMAGLRDIISHQYFNINLDMIWEAIKVKAPEFEKRIAA